MVGGIPKKYSFMTTEESVQDLKWDLDTDEHDTKKKALTKWGSFLFKGNRNPDLRLLDDKLVVRLDRISTDEAANARISKAPGDIYCSDGKYWGVVGDATPRDGRDTDAYMDLGFQRKTDLPSVTSDSDGDSFIDETENDGK
ncbi:hypothetical protein [Archangium sp.]|uniref:hypothetical protein n=1 Tax=Archangium sp. TaxID=1872627 RepID=UPI00286D16CA|nr:hypothetical protein [Archangium sp.]